MTHVTYSDDYCFDCEKAIKQIDTEHNEHFKLTDNNPEATYRNARGVLPYINGELPEDTIRRSRGHQDESPPSLGCCILGLILVTPFWIGVYVFIRFMGAWTGGG